MEQGGLDHSSSDCVKMHARSSIVWSCSSSVCIVSNISGKRLWSLLICFLLFAEWYACALVLAFSGCLVQNRFA